MHAVDGSVQQDTLTRPRRSWVRRSRFIALALLAVALTITWLTGVLDERLDQWVAPTKGEGSAFVITTYPKVDPPPNAGLSLRLKYWYQTQKLSWGLRMTRPSRSGSPLNLCSYGMFPTCFIAACGRAEPGIGLPKKSRERSALEQRTPSTGLSGLLPLKTPCAKMDYC